MKHDTTGWLALVSYSQRSGIDKVAVIRNAENEHVATLVQHDGSERWYFDYHRSDMWSWTVEELMPLIQRGKA